MARSYNTNKSSDTMDIIYIRDLRVETLIGVFEWERRIRQSISLDLEMATDIRKAAASDDLADTLDYKSIAKRVMEFAAQCEYQLVETLAEEICRLVREEFGVRWIRLSLNKTGALRGARDVGVIIERGERD